MVEINNLRGGDKETKHYLKNLKSDAYIFYQKRKYFQQSYCNLHVS